VVVLLTPQRFFAVLIDFATYPAWYPGVSEAEDLTAAGNGEPRARLVFDAGLRLLPTIDCVVRFESRPPTRLRPRVESGDLKLEGDGWRLEALAGARTAVTFDVTAEIELPGGRLVARAVEPRARHYLIEAPVTALKRRVEA